jgi:hypothetical protein
MSYSIGNTEKYNYWFCQKIILIVFLLAVINDITGQTNYLPGYIITNDNDTINGFIDYRGDIRNSKKCRFKIDETATIIEYKPFEIRGFRFIVGKFYVSKSMPINNLKDSIFAEYLVNGIVDLYYYRDYDNDHYYIEKNNGETIELSNEEIKEYTEAGREYVRNSNKYIGLLKATFSDCLEIQPELNVAKLDHKSLINVTKKYHDFVCKDQQCIIYEKQLPVIKIRLAPVVSMNISDLTFSDNTFYSYFNFENSTSLSIGGILNASMPRLNEKISSQFEISIGKNYFYSLFIKQYDTYRTDYYDFHIRTTYLKGSGAIKYTYPKGKLRPVASLGGSLYYFINSKYKLSLKQVFSTKINNYEFDNILIPGFLFGGFGRIGVNYYLDERRILFFTLSYDYNYGNNHETSAAIKTLGFNLGIFL